MSEDGVDDVAGRVGVVSVAIPGGDRPGEIIVQIRGGTERYIAYAESPIDRGREVLVVTARGARMVNVLST